MLKQHRFYAYHNGSTVFARMDEREPVAAEELKSPQEAHDLVQAIVNPEGHDPSYYGPKGFNEKAFQEMISPNCERFVREAYAAAGRSVEGVEQ